MTEGPLVISLEVARRLAVTKQRLAGAPPMGADSETVRSVIRDLGYVQWDPVTVVAPSHLISLWARIPDFRAPLLEEMLWEERSVFEHWTPMASIVLTEDYPLYASLMRRYPDSMSSSWGRQRESARQFLARNAGLRRAILRDLRSGPMRVGDFEAHARTQRRKVEWAPSGDVSEMLFHLTMKGEVMVVGHRGNQNLWGLAREFLPRAARRPALSEAEAERVAAQRAIRALGTADPREIHFHFVRGRYHHLKRTLAELVDLSLIRRVRVEGLPTTKERYLHASDVALAETLAVGPWEPRMALLPPFDNMVISQDRLKRLFDFDYVREQFLPKEKRRYGTFVLPILWGSRFIGRIDPWLDKENRRLVIRAVHAEPGIAGLGKPTPELGRLLRRFATFLGVDDVLLPGKVPSAFRGLRV